MLDRNKFMETLRSVAEIARVSQQPLSKEEIDSYFSNMELTREQQEMIYQYLQNPQSEEDVQEDQEESNDNNVQSEEENNNNYEESKFLQMYLEEIKDIPRLSSEDKKKAYDKLLEGDATALSRISDHWLQEVVILAKEYERYDRNMEDLIQEGNMGLITGMNHLHGSKQVIDVEQYLKESVQQAIENYIDEMNDEDDWENTVIAKSNLIYEAKKALAEDMGRMPTVQELCDYTRLTQEEIEEILKLSAE